MYVRPNFKTKKAFKEAVQQGKLVHFFDLKLEAKYGHAGYDQDPNDQDGTYFIEGPHFPEPHTWYAEVTVKDGKIVRIK